MIDDYWNFKIINIYYHIDLLWHQLRKMNTFITFHCTSRSKIICMKIGITNFNVINEQRFFFFAHGHRWKTCSFLKIIHTIKKSFNKATFSTKWNAF